MDILSDNASSVTIHVHLDLHCFFSFVQQNGIPLPVTPKKPWSTDANLMHIRCGVLLQLTY